MEINKIYNMDCIEGINQLEDKSIDLIVTSPPYNMNDTRYYGEYKDNKSEEEYIGWLKELFGLVYLKLKDDGVVCFNISYNSNSKSSYIKIINEFLNLGFQLQESISWLKRGMPLTEIGNLTRDFEFLFVLNKGGRIKTTQKNNQVISNVWDIKNKDHNKGTNKACFPIALPRKCIELYSNEGDLVVDPFMGSGTTAFASKQLNRNFIGFDVSKEYCDIADERLNQNTLFDIPKLQQSSLNLNNTNGEDNE